MKDSATSDTELLTEHLGYPPVSLIDDIINSINILAERALNSVEQGLLNANPSSLGFKQPPPKSHHHHQDAPDPPEPYSLAEAAKTEIESGTHQLETLLCAQIDRNFDRFEIYILRNILCVREVGVRDWMRLSHYDGLDFSSISSASASASSNPAPSLESISLLRRKLRESMRLNALLTAERAKNARMLDSLRALVGAEPGGRIKTESSEPPVAAALGAEGQGGPDTTMTTTTTVPQQSISSSSTTSSPFAFLHEKADLNSAGGSTPLTTTTAFTLSQMQALRAISTSLRTMTPDLLPPAGQSHAPTTRDHPDLSSEEDVDSDSRKKKKGTKKTWRRERLEYVEGATRRHLETVQGLELGRDGEVRDGEWQGPGRGLGRGEVEGLERVVAILGSGGGGGEGGDSGGGGAAAAFGANKNQRGGGEEVEVDGEDGNQMDES
ncbi:Mis12 protein-domain-containing protein [Xylariomycetidae sp. FL2044]|nr:Mis12 protein-domain-containing protein [Xylariomycetidae sp. FL2044]